MTSLDPEPTAADFRTNRRDRKTVRKDNLTLGGFSPSSVVLFVAATCGFGMLWGAVDQNWVLFATELPVVLSLGVIWFLTRRRQNQSDLARAAVMIGLACAVEVWIATLVFDARGLTLAIVVAISTALTFSAAVTYWLVRRPSSV